MTSNRSSGVLQEAIDAESEISPAGERRGQVISCGAIAAIALCLYASSRYNYLLFHGLVELASIAIGFTLFIITWNVRHFLFINTLKILGIGYAFIAGIDLLHTLAYKGMNVFPGYGANLPTQLWIAARYLQAATLCVAPLVLRRKIDEHFLVGLYAAVVALLVALVFTGLFPDCFIDGKGLTPFKIGSEYLIIAMLGGALALFHRARAAFNPRVYALLVASIVCTALSELAFTAYLSVYGFANMLGHLLKLAAFYLIYRALLVTGFKEPYQLIFRELKEAYDRLGEANVSLEIEVEERRTAEDELREARDQLESLVAARTAELQTSNAQLLQSEARLIEAQRIAHLGNWELDLVNNALFWSDEVFRIFEIDQGAFGASYEAFLAAVHPDDRDVVNNAYTRSLADRTPYDIVHRLVMADGRIKYVNERCETNYGEDGRPLRSIGTIHDITDLKRSEEALLYLAAIVEFSDDAIIGKTPEGIIQSWNRGAERLYGYSAAEVVGCSVSVLVPEDCAAEIPNILDRIKRGGAVDRFETVRLRKDGSRVDVSLTVSPIFDAVGRLIGASTIAVDISDRKRAEAELLQLNAKLQILSSAIDQSPVSILITDSRGIIQFVNPKFSMVTGYAAEEVLGKNPRLLKSGRTSPDEYRRLWATISSGDVWHGEFYNRKKNGEFFFENATIAPVKNRQGSITHYIAIKEDITEKRKLEEQLRQSQKMEAIGILAGGVAHDFNNILTVIIGFGSMLDMSMPADDPLRNNVTQILAAADRAASLTRSLLAFSRKQSIEMKVTDLNAIVSGLEKMLHRLIREDIDLSISLSDRQLPVLVDAGQIEQVLINLVANSRDAMPGGGKLAISIDETTLDQEFSHVHGYGEPGGYAILVIADNGVGMTEEVRTRIFDPFFTTKEIGKGTGLGLSVCYGIVKQHGGYINCYSEPGKGTTFRLYLPLARGEVAAINPAVTMPVTGGTETILVAEDDPGVRELTNRILTEFGYTVIEASDGAEAVARFQEAGDSIDLCLFDVIMPHKKGWEALAEIRGIRPEVKALFMSGYQPDFDRLQDMIQNDAGFIAKPVVPRDLLRKIRELLDG